MTEAAAEASGVVHRSTAILRTISENAADGLTTTAIARSTALPRPTVHRLLEALDAEGMVERDRRSGRWFLGPEIYVLGAASVPRFDIVEKASSRVDLLSRETGESAFFSLRRGDHTVVLLRQDGDFPIRSHVLYEGVRFPLGVVSAGLAVLAYLPATEITAYLRRAELHTTWGQSHTVAAIRRRVAETKVHGWALNPGLVVEGSWGMAAAVFDIQGAPIGALTLTGIESRFGPERRPWLGQLLLQEANTLSQAVRR